MFFAWFEGLHGQRRGTIVFVCGDCMIQKHIYIKRAERDTHVREEIHFQFLEGPFKGSTRSSAWVWSLGSCLALVVLCVNGMKGDAIQDRMFGMPS